MEFNKDYIENYNEERDEGWFIEFDVQYPDELDELYNDVPFLSERMKIGKVEKLFSQLVR